MRSKIMMALALLLIVFATVSCSSNVQVDPVEEVTDDAVSSDETGEQVETLIEEESVPEDVEIGPLI